MLSGFAAMQGHLRFSLAAGAITLGVWVVMVGLYLLGRWRAAWVRLKARAAPPLIRRTLRILRSNPWRSTLLARFAFGGRIVLPLACGAARVPVGVFLVGAAMASASWSVVYSALGWFFGRSVAAIHGHIQRVEEVVLAALIVLMFLGAFVWWRRRQAPSPERTS
jgi:membrane protein DedA with SNARE-associated domain